jgi:hypothetical protein
MVNPFELFDPRVEAARNQLEALRFELRRLSSHQSETRTDRSVLEQAVAASLGLEYKLTIASLSLKRSAIERAGVPEEYRSAWELLKGRKMMDAEEVDEVFQEVKDFVKRVGKEFEL